MYELVAATVSQIVAEHAADGLETLPHRSSAGRAERLKAYAALQGSVLRAQLRIGSLFTVHSTQFNLLNVIPIVTGFPLVVSMLNQLTNDLTAVIADWRRVRLVGNDQAAAEADGLVLALCDLMQHVDPGWHRPTARRRRRRAHRSAEERLEHAARRFDLALQADAAPRRGDRRLAKRTLGELASSPV